MKKLTIATLTVLTTLGISAYTNGHSQSLGKVNTVENQNNTLTTSNINAANSIISNEVGRANLAQAD